MAQGAIDSFEDLMRVRVEGISGGRAGERQSNHLRLAESSAEIDALRLTLRHNIKLLIDSANSGDDPSTGERLRIRRDITFAGKLCHRATQRLLRPAAPMRSCGAPRCSASHATSMRPFIREC